MAQNEVNQYDEVAANNVDLNGQTVVQTQMYPPGVPLSFRNLMAALKRTFRSDLFRVRDATTQTKLLAFDLSAFTAATTRTVSFPDKSGTAAFTSDLTSLQTQIDAAAKVNDTRRNLWVNGSFDVSQENTNTLGTTTGYYPADQVALFFTASTAAMSVQRVQVRSLANALNQIEYKCTTAKASLGATDFVTLTQNIEGSAIAAAGFGTAAAIPIVMRLQETLPAGTYHVHCSNGTAANRHVAIPFTATGAAEVKTIVIPADTGGTWLTADGVIGMTVDIVLAAGATLTGGTASTWSGSTFYAASTQFNILSSTANVARIADVGVKLDAASTGVYGTYRVGEVDPFYRSERYVEIAPQPQSLTNSASGANLGYGEIRLTFVKCKVPTASVSTAFQYYSTTVATAMTPTFNVITETRIGFQLTGATNFFGWVGTGRVLALARLS